MDTQQKQQIADKLLKSSNILVTVSSNPSVDQLAACLGLTLALNKMGKHAAAVFSGEVPNTLEFLQPEKTIEKTTDSLRDFIISLDKAKADKLRYKVEDKVVKIFITPYKTSISDKDLEFSQGDFNVDVVVAIGVHSQADIDQAITAHGRILHDAVVSTINVTSGGEQLGAMNWLHPSASSLCELIVQLLDAMKQKVMDGQMATALLTGIVAETQRFSNSKTSAQTMTISAELMAAGANPQLVATKLEEPKKEPKEEPPKPEPKAEPEVKKPAEPAPVETPKPVGPLAEATPSSVPAAKPSEGMLEIEHLDLDSPTSVETNPSPEPLTPQIDIDHEGTLRRLEELKASQPMAAPAPSETGGRKVLQPLSTSQVSPGSSMASPLVPADNLTLPQPAQDDFERPSGAPPLPPSQAVAGSSFAGFGAPSVPPATMSMPPFDPSSGPVVSQPAPSAVPSAADTAAAHLAGARDAVDAAHGAAASATVPTNPPLEPITALNAMPLHLPLRDDQSVGSSIGAPSAGLNLPPLTPPAGTTPPPVPPPMLPPVQQ